MSAVTTCNGELVRSWQLPYSARLGSSVRSKGMFLELRGMLPKAMQQSLTVKAGELTLRMPAEAADAFSDASAIVSKALESIASRPVIPREIEDILGISTTERRRWLADGRLPSFGTRTMKLRGRGTITFHVFDPRVVEDILDRNAIDGWREDDAVRATENRRRAAWRAKLTRTQTRHGSAPSPSANTDEEDRFKLRGWAAFERQGPLR
jgi:hypothetical protein